MEILSEIQIKEKIINSFTDDQPLFYVESGSRLWRMASPNSDYDIRGFHIESKDKYFDYKPHRDLKEIMDGDFDFVSYSIDKMFSLISNSNPTALEWLRSDIVYYNQLKEWDSFKSQVLENINYLSLFGHYASLSRNNFKLIEEGKKITYKTALYCIRGIVSAKVSLKEIIPQLIIDDLFNQVEKDQLIDIAYLCLEKKKLSEEKTDIEDVLKDKVIKSIKNALDYLAEIEFKTESKKDKLSNILTEYSIQVKQNYY